MNQNRIFGNGAKWAGGQVGAMRIMATMMSPKCTMRKGIKKETRSPKERAQDTIRSEGAHTRIETERAGRHLPRPYAI